jgi:FkbM family methyltransferase
MLTGKTHRTTEYVLNELKGIGISIDTVYDIGANDSRWYKLWKPKLPDSTFFLFEANPANFCKAELGVDEQYNHVALSDSVKEVSFYLPDTSNVENTGGSYYKEFTPQYDGETNVKLTTTTLDQYVEDNKLPMPDFIKLDTQGSEVDILNGSKRILEHTSVILCEVPVLPYNRGAPDLSTYILTLQSYGFIPTGIEHIAIKSGALMQMDLVFVKKDIIQDLYKDTNKFGGF